MSGGVDSSVAAGLLHEAGYEVVGVTMKTWDYETSLGGSGVSRKQSGCCSLDDMNDARAVAVALGAAHTVVDIRDEFGGWVVDRFADDYLAGRTPNPCVLCNTHIKWAALLKRADALGCEQWSNPIADASRRISVFASPPSGKSVRARWSCATPHRTYDWSLVGSSPRLTTWRPARSWTRA